MSNRSDTNPKSRPLVGEVPKLYSIFKGEIVSIQPYGVFIKIPGCSKNGLVHRSQISNTPIDNPEEVVSIKERIYCKVIAAEADGSKIALSMKVVNQTTGRDLDPTNLESSMDEKRRKSSTGRGQAPIELEAVFKTTCRKCGGSGHLAQDCFHRPGDKTYELLLDDDETIDNVTDNVHDDAPSKKKLKKRKHSRDEDSDGHHKHKKKHKKKEKSPDSQTASKHRHKSPDSAVGRRSRDRDVTTMTSSSRSNSHHRHKQSHTRTSR